MNEDLELNKTTVEETSNHGIQINIEDPEKTAWEMKKTGQAEMGVKITVDNSKYQIITPDKLGDLKYIFQDILAGDKSATLRPEFKQLGFDKIKKTLEWLANNNDMSSEMKTLLMTQGWRLNFRDKPPTPEEFLTPKYIGDQANTLHPWIKETFLKFFNPLSPYRNLILSSCIGTGKSTLTVLANMYIALQFAFMWAPYKYYGYAPSTQFTIVFGGFSQKKAYELLMGPLLNVLRQADFWQQCRTMDDMIKANKEFNNASGIPCIYWTTAAPTSCISISNNLNFNIVSSNGDIIGQNIIMGSATELGFWREQGGWTDEQIYEELKARGLIAQVTDEQEIKEMVNNGKAVFYIGFDPTADSLHVGHFMALCLMKRLQMAGNKPVVLIGGGTAMVGDPSGRTDMRQMMTEETIAHNVECFKQQMSRFIDFGEGKAILVNNKDWLMQLNYVEVLRDVGACFSVNKMLSAECYKQRMEKGLSFLEFNYMIMQSYDFYHLYKNYGCNMQFGGDDQWSNMLGGTELIRRKLGKDAYAMTITLLLNSEGKKMGKTASGAVWLDPKKTTPYDFYQYWRNVNDADVLKCIRMLTFLPLEQIDAMDSWEGAQLNTAKEILAYELTKLVHGEEEAEKAQAQARSLFSAGGEANAPEYKLTDADFTGGMVEGQIDIGSVMVKAGLVKSKSEARTAIQQGGVTVDGEKVTDFKTA